MGHKYTKVAFTSSVKEVQSEQGSRDGYARWETGPDFAHELSQAESQFIEARDSMYMASVSETGWPYVQHRGGPTGFVKVVDKKTLAFADFRGNRQYISTGNFRKNNRVALFFMDYANKTRLKLIGRVKVISPADIESLTSINDPRYDARVERGFYIEVEGFDWNCPQHITPRFSQQQVDRLLAPLIAENQQIKQAKANSAQTQSIGEGSLTLTITGIRQLTPRIRAYELRSTKGKPLPEFKAGAHLQIPVPLESGELEFRHYSICSNPARRDIYEIAVLKDNNGSGGSRTIHQGFQLGTQLNIEPPENFFPLNPADQHSVLVAAGIGITAIKAMAQELSAQNKSFELHFAGKSKQEMAFYDRLHYQFKDQITTYCKSENRPMSLTSLMLAASAKATFYFCGPERLINEALEIAQAHGIGDERIHYERFATQHYANDSAFKVTLTESGLSFCVDAQESLLDALLSVGVELPHSCKTGNCRSCVTQVVAGEVDHRDAALSHHERHSGQLMCPCVSRAKSDKLTLAL